MPDDDWTPLGLRAAAVLVVIMGGVLGFCVFGLLAVLLGGDGRRSAPLVLTASAVISALVVGLFRLAAALYVGQRWATQVTTTLGALLLALSIWMLATRGGSAPDAYFWPFAVFPCLIWGILLCISANLPSARRYPGNRG